MRSRKPCRLDQRCRFFGPEARCSLIQSFLQVAFKHTFTSRFEKDEPTVRPLLSMTRIEKMFPGPYGLCLKNDLRSRILVDYSVPYLSIFATKRHIKHKIIFVTFVLFCGLLRRHLFQ